MITGKLSKILNSDHLSVIKQPRNYIGASIIGHPCYRAIWYELHNTTPLEIPPRTNRIFETGNALEKLVISWIMLANLRVFACTEPVECEELPIFKGSYDAFLPYFGAILEIKTAKDSSFKVFVRAGLRKWYPIYYAQVQSYMGMGGFKYAYVLVINKDTSELHDELVEFDYDFYQELVEKAKAIATSEKEPPRISSNPLWYQCKICSYKGVCHG